MANLIKTILYTTITLLSIDSIYLYLISPFFGKMIQNIQNSPMKVKWYSVCIVYILLITGLIHFIILPNKSIMESALFGLIVYGIFDFTNHALFKNYTLDLAIKDMLWGAILCSSTTFIVKKLLPLK